MCAAKARAMSSRHGVATTCTERGSPPQTIQWESTQSAHPSRVTARQCAMSSQPSIRVPSMSTEPSDQHAGPPATGSSATRQQHRVSRRTGPIWVPSGHTMRNAPLSTTPDAGVTRGPGQVFAVRFKVKPLLGGPRDPAPQHAQLVRQLLTGPLVRLAWQQSIVSWHRGGPELVFPAQGHLFVRSGWQD